VAAVKAARTADRRTVVEEAPLDNDRVALGRSAHGGAGEEHGHLAAEFAEGRTVSSHSRSAFPRMAPLTSMLSRLHISRLYPGVGSLFSANDILDA
jgi:hypothetical protein